jgi:hypothetical protein
MNTHQKTEKGEMKLGELGVRLTRNEKDEGRRVLSRLEGRDRLLQFKRGLSVTQFSHESLDPTLPPSTALTAEPTHTPITQTPTTNPSAPPPPTVGGTTLTCLVHIRVVQPRNIDMNATASRIDLDLFQDYTNKNLQMYVNKALAALIASDSFKDVDVKSKKRKITNAIVERITWKKDSVQMRIEKAVNRPSNRAYLAVFKSPVDEYVKILLFSSFFLLFFLLHISTSHKFCYSEINLNIYCTVYH